MTTTDIKPAFSFNNDQVLNTFDLLMEKTLSFKFEGTLFDNMWIYRKSPKEFISLQVGLGGVLFTEINNTDDNGRVSSISVDMTDVDNPAKLIKKLKVILAD